MRSSSEASVQRRNSSTKVPSIPMQSKTCQFLAQPAPNRYIVFFFKVYSSINIHYTQYCHLCDDNFHVTVSAVRKFELVTVTLFWKHVCPNHWSNKQYLVSKKSFCPPFPRFRQQN